MFQAQFGKELGAQRSGSIVLQKELWERIHRALFFQLIILANKGLHELQKEVFPFVLLSF